MDRPLAHWVRVGRFPEDPCGTLDQDTAVAASPSGHTVEGRQRTGCYGTVEGVDHEGR